MLVRTAIRMPVDLGRLHLCRTENCDLIALISFQILPNWPSPLSSAPPSENACILREAFLLQRYLSERLEECFQESWGIYVPINFPTDYSITLNESLCFF